MNEQTSFPPSFSDEAEEHFRTGRIRHGQGRLDEAVQCLSASLLLRPDSAGYRALGDVLRDQSKCASAAACYRRAVALSPQDPHGLVALGEVLLRLDSPAEAEAILDRAVALAPGLATARHGLGLALRGMGRLDEAVRRFDEGLALGGSTGFTPSDLLPRMRLDKSIALLAGGRLAEGFALYDARLELARPRRRALDLPMWQGEDLNGRTILLHTEQGPGNAIQFARYIPLVADRGGRIVLECPQPLRSLLARLKGVDKVVVRSAVLPDCDVQAPLGSLPRIFGTDLAAIPAAVPYLQAPEDSSMPNLPTNGETGGLDGSRGSGQATGLGAGQLAGQGTGYPRKVGIVWAADTDRMRNAGPSMDFTLFLGLAGMPAVTLYSLQTGERAGDRNVHACPALVPDLGGNLLDFADAAKILSQLDLLITVDSALAHLAGAMARPVWNLIPHAADWRWMTGRDDSPWYPTMRLFRQDTPGDWKVVMDKVAKALEEWARG